MTTQVYIVKKTVDFKLEENGNTILLPISRTDGKKGKSGLAIEIEQVSQAVLNVLMNSEVGNAWLIEQVNGLRSKVASALNKAGKQILSDKLGVTALLEAMKAENESQRFTKESIKVWFDEYLSGPLSDAVCAKYHGIDNGKLGKLLNTYLENFQVLAGRSPSMTAAVKSGLIRALEFLPEEHDSITANQIAERLEVVQEPVAMIDML